MSGLRTWAVGTAATVLSIAGVGLLSAPALGADSTEGVCPKTGGDYKLEPVTNYNDENNPPIAPPNAWSNFDDSNGVSDGYICFKWTQGSPHTYDAYEKGVLKDNIVKPK